ncbi:CtsR family transcriptional regulator [Crassaminicella profunda]|uniref:CtsR family transcriptional regulator n=1 Tax=Crassaminicella profunda TaxID=1286698 RepID=UPI001CA76364|nr:CtsR family transcriptional regulator [Crassaminicella profunda]QZY54667.1 CtsR family transcriptional regulator [Crassaminicella profunda]
MPRLSDIIEIFLKELLQDANNKSIEIQRNELASYFNCAPSQINYVLTTRFSLDKGYLIESRRGGGGHIKIFKINVDKNEYVRMLLEEIGDSVSKMRGSSIIEVLKEKKIITERESVLMKAAISDRSIHTPMNIKDEVRANLLKSMMIAIFNYNGRE